MPMISCGSTNGRWNRTEALFVSPRPCRRRQGPRPGWDSPKKMSVVAEAGEGHFPITCLTWKTFLDAERTTPWFLLVNCKQFQTARCFVVHPGCQMPCHLGATSTLGSRTGNSTKQDVMRVTHKAINLKTNWLPWDGKPSPKDSGKKLWLGKSRESWSWKQRDLVLLERHSGSTITGTLEPQMKNIEQLKKDDASKFEISCLYSLSYIYLDCYKNLV